MPGLNVVVDVRESVDIVDAGRTHGPLQLPGRRASAGTGAASERSGNRAATSYTTSTAVGRSRYTPWASHGRCGCSPSTLRVKTGSPQG